MIQGPLVRPLFGGNPSPVMTYLSTYQVNKVTGCSVYFPQKRISGADFLRRKTELSLSLLLAGLQGPGLTVRTLKVCFANATKTETKHPLPAGAVNCQKKPDRLVNQLIDDSAD